MQALEKNIASKVKMRPFVAALGIPIVITTALYLVRLNEVTPLQLVLAFLLLLLPWHEYRQWRRGGNKLALPVFALLAFMYWLYYAVPLFLEDHVFATINEPIGHELSSETITLALIMALIGVCALWVGMRLGISKLLVPRARLSL